MTITSRDKILQSIKQNKPELVNLPKVSLDAEVEDLFNAFQKGLDIAAGSIITNSQLLEYIDNPDRDISTTITDFYIDKKLVRLCSTYAKGNTPPDILIIEGAFGVAENGAIWIKQEEQFHAILPFICEHLIIVLNKSNLVANMHDAYKLLEETERTNGVFIAGPSKTADIEQTLVIGAQGARTLKVLM